MNLYLIVVVLNEYSRFLKNTSKIGVKQVKTIAILIFSHQYIDKHDNYAENEKKTTHRACITQRSYSLET